MSKKHNKKRPVTRSERIKAKATSLNENGHGMIKYQGKSVPVPFLLAGEEALLDLEKVGKHYQSTIQSVIKRSPDRVSPTCPYYYSCGGCQLQHLDYKKQGKLKENQVKGLLPKKKVDPIILMKEPYYYRNKVIASVATQNKKLITGFYKPFSHEVVAIDHCEVQMPQADKILKTLRSLCSKHKIQAYNEDTQNGFLRHILLKMGHKTDEVLVTFVVASKVFPSKAKLLKDLKEAHPEIKSITMNINNRKTSVVLGKEEIILHGDGKIKDNLCGYDFKISSQSFYQINPVQTEKLYQTAMDLAQIKKDEVVLDTYSGIGTISIIATKHAKMVYGVELNKEAVKDANHNAKLNKINNIKFVQADATHAMVQMAKERFHIDVLFLDPPREGSTPEFINAALKLKPKKIVYISCNPYTLARDLKLFEKAYKVERVVPVDMFPHTSHVECISRLVRKEKK